jgi:hypothetical protein
MMPRLCSASLLRTMLLAPVSKTSSTGTPFIRAVIYLRLPRSVKGMASSARTFSPMINAGNKEAKKKNTVMEILVITTSSEFEAYFLLAFYHIRSKATKRKEAI